MSIYLAKQSMQPSENRSGPLRPERQKSISEPDPDLPGQHIHSCSTTLSVHVILTGTIWLGPFPVTCLFVLFTQDTHTLSGTAAVYSRRRGTHVHKMRAHPGYRLWYCRQHCSTLSSLFSAFRPSRDRKRRHFRPAERIMSGLSPH